MDILIREVNEDDYNDWLVLWDAYNSIGGSKVSNEVTTHTWNRINDPNSPVLCRVAELNNQIVGFLLCVLHEGTFVITPVCYLEDFFVHESLRGGGIGRAMLQCLHDEAVIKGWSKVYWFTRTNNAARKLYDKVATTDDFVRYRMAL
ncbi:GNAT family N-acetyltransferase [Kosakonia sp. BK9b]|uniref:GNAT family N-acetyltransferase n=1 Tax=Kosakonia sp. TaxID=1916651 RepID=UPI0028A13214|nr:GNAT family N-acetyltransferase [Kosakonia sp.]